MPEELNKLMDLLVVVAMLHRVQTLVVAAIPSVYQEKAWVQGYIRITFYNAIALGILTDY